MEVKDWTRIENLFHETLRLDAEERAAYLAHACTGDGLLRAEVESLLAAFERRKDYMETPAFELGMKLLSNEASDALVGKLLGPYKILKLLGQGGMGTVYLGEDTRLGRKVALKFLLPQLVDDSWAKRQLAKEAQAAAMLEHPNICAIYGIEEIEGHSFIVMPYVEGETLASLIKKQLVDNQQAVSFAVQIVNAVAEAHAHGIIHRDIKPQNIVVTTGGQLKVLDFGLAKIIQRQQEAKEMADDASQISQSGLVIGTVAYMSPEQLRAERLDFRSDIFSIGTVLYELISGKKPFARDSDAEIIAAILTSLPAKLTHESNSVPPELSRIVLKCLEKEKEQRYQSASGLLYELESFQQSLGNNRPRRFVSLRLATACVLLLLMLFAIWSFASRNWSFASRAENKSYTLAILPVNNESANAELDYLQDGFASNLIIKLSRFPALRVNAFTTVSGYRGPGLEPKQIGHQLGVEALLLGKIIRQGKFLVLQMSLIKTEDGSEIWSEQYDINSISISDLQEKVSEKIATHLGLPLGDNEKKLLAERETINDEALKEYIRGRDFWSKRDKENILKAIDKFHSALQLDSAYARAWAGLADCYALMNTTAYGNLSTAEAMDRAQWAARRALELDKNLPEAHISLGIVNFKYYWNWQEAEAQFKQALNLDPEFAQAHFWYSNLLVITGRQAEAMMHSQRAKKLDPFSPATRANVCRSYYYARQYDEAVRCINDELQEQPDNISAKYFLGFVYERQGLSDKAIEIFQKLPDKNKELKIVALGYAYGRAGRKADALNALAELEEMARQPKANIPAQEIAVIYLGLGDNDNFFKWLEKAYQDRFAPLLYFTVDPCLDGMRSDPRFADLIRRLDLPLLQPQT